MDQIETTCCDVMLTQRAFSGCQHEKLELLKQQVEQQVVLVRMRRRLDLLNYSHPHLTSGYMDGSKIITSVNFHKKAMSNL